jgi:hypothetical protein
MLNHPEESEELMIGTRWKDGQADVYGWSMANEPNKFHWVQRSVYNDDGSIAFHQRFTEETLAAIQLQNGPYLFSCNYLNNPIPPEGGDFKGSDLRYYEIDFANQEIVPTDGTPRVKLKDLLRTSFLDPSSGGQSAKCENGLVATGGDWFKRIFVLEAVGKNCTMGQAVEEWHHLNDKMYFHKNYYEAVGAHKEVGDIINTRSLWPECLLCKAKGLPGIKHKRLIAEGITPTGGRGGESKDDRIRNYLQVPLEEHRVYVRRDRANLVTQITSFPHYHLKDLIDAAAYCVKYTQFPPPPEELESRKIDEDRMKNRHVGRIATKYEYGGYA